jgi:hypothetical protein
MQHAVCFLENRPAAPRFGRGTIGTPVDSSLLCWGTTRRIAMDAIWRQDPVEESEDHMPVQPDRHEAMMHGA